MSAPKKATKKRDPKELTVVCQRWEESERGWGVRPDGYSLHLTEAHRAAYIVNYTKDRVGPAPDVYDRPDGDPYVARVDRATYDDVKKKSRKKGIRVFNNVYPSPSSQSRMPKNGWQYSGV